MTRSPRRRRWLVLGGVLIVGLLGAWLAGVLVERRVHRELVSGLASSLDADVSVVGVDVAFFPPRLEVEGLEVRRGGHVLGSVKRLTADLSGRELLRRRIHVVRLEVRAPHWLVDPPGVPVARPAPPSASGDLPDVTIVELRVTEGSLGWWADSVPMSLTKLEATSDRLLQDGAGSVDLSATFAAAGGPAALADGAQLSAALSHRGQEIVLERFDMDGREGLEARGRGSLRLPDDSKGLEWRGEVDGALAVGALVRQLSPEADESFRGRARWTAQASGSRDDWTAEARVTSPELLWNDASGEALEAGDVDARITATPKSLVLEEMTAALAGGRVRASATFALPPADPVLSGDVELLDLRVVELPWTRALQPSLAVTSASILRGRITGSVPVGDLLSANGEVELTMLAPPGQPEALPEIQLSAAATAEGITVRRAIVQSSVLQARAAGTLSWKGDGQLDVRAEVPVISSALRSWIPRVSGGARDGLSSLSARGLDGAFTLEGRLSGTPDRPDFQGRLGVEELALRGSVLGRLSSQLRATAEHLEARTGSLKGGEVDLTFSGRLPWTSTSGGEATVELRRAELPLLAAVLESELELEGEVSGTVRVRPATSSPTVSAVLEMSTGSVNGVELRNAAVDATLVGSRLSLPNASVEVAGGTVTASGEVPLDGGELSLVISGLGLDLQQVPGGPRAVGGSASFEVTLGGSPQAPLPGGPARWTVDDLVVSERRLGTVRGELELSDRGYELRVAGLEGALRAEGRIGRQADRPIEATFELDAIDLALPGPDGEEVSLRGAGFAGTVAGRLSAPAELRHSLQADWVEARRAGLELRSESLALTGTGSRVRTERVVLDLLGHELELAGSVNLLDPLDHALRLEGQTALSLLESWMPGTQLEGTAELGIDSRGDGTEVLLGGELRIRGGKVRVEGFPQALENLEATATLAAGELVLRQATATLGGGLVTGEGRASLEGFRPEQGSFALEGADVELRLADGLTSLSSFELKLAADREGGLLSGAVTVHEARYTKDLRLEASLASPGTAPPSSTVPGPLDQLRLDLVVLGESGLHVDNDLAAVELGAEIEVVGSASRPVLVGTARTVDEGRLVFQRTRYRLVEGTAILSLAHPNDPELDVLAETRLADHDIELRLSGRVSDPKVGLRSTPELATERIVALLATKGAIGAGSGDVVPAELAADFVKGRMGLVNDTMKRLTGLDVFELDPSLGLGQGDHVARLTAGKKLTERVTAIVSTDLGGDSDSSAALHFKATKALALRAAHEASGANALGLTWTRPRRNPTAPKGSAALGAFVIGEVELTGLPPEADPTELAAILALEPGQEESYRGLRRAARRLRTTLQDRGRVLARVRCEVATESPPPAGPLDIRCELTPGPPVELELNGSIDEKLAREARDAILEEWRELFRPRDLAPEAEAACRRVLAERGRVNSRVSVSEDVMPERHLVKLEVEPGPVVRAKGFEFPGAESLEADALRSAARSAARATLRRSLVTPSFLADATEAVRDLYRSEGWLDARVGPATLRESAGGSRATVVIPVEERSRIRLASVSFSGNELWTDDRLAPSLRSELGEPLRPQELDATCRELVATYDSTGHPDATARWSWKPVDGGAAVTVSISEGPRVEIGTVTVRGAERTRERFIERMAGLKPGEPYGRDRVAEAGRRLVRTGLFARAAVRGIPSAQDRGLRDVVIQVLERDPLRVAVGGALDDQEGPRFTFALSHANLDGRGLSFANNLSLGDIDRQAEVVLQVREIGRRSTDLRGSFGLRQQDEPGFTLERLGLALEASRRVGTKDRLQTSLRLENVNLRDVLLSELDPDLDEGLLAELGTAWSRDTRDSAFAPTRGRLTTARLGLGLGPAGSETKYARLFVRHATFHELRRGLSYSASVRLGFGWAIAGARLPLSERFRAGGLTTVRGFSRDSLGPKDALTGEPVGGEALLVLNQELVVQMGQLLTGHVFLDAGNVQAHLDELFSANLRRSTGIGVGMKTPVGPLRLYHAWVVDREPGEGSGRFHFAISSTF